MRTHSLSVLFGLASGAALGFSAAHGLAHHGAGKTQSTAPLSASARANAAAPNTTPTIQTWLAKLDAVDWDRPDAAVLTELQHALAADPLLRGAVMDVYRTKTDRRVRSAFRSLLTANPAPDVIARSLELAQSPNPLDRAAGFELVAESPPNEVASALAERAVTEERDPDALVGALLALRARIPPSPSAIGNMLPRLLTLIHHEAILVRAHGVQVLAEWDRSGKTAEPVVAAALSDPAPVVRQAAVGAVMLGQLRSERIQQSLLRIQGDRGEDLQTRFGAQQALERFDMDSQAYEAYAHARAELDNAAQARTVNATSTQR